ncbi:MAG TPA: PPC domain-containing DNA-binding protein [Thermoanaerobaculia bacterium]|nr:PPC domain-containing DNA-binding protein [Thermoanaerobaculia bacterium]
MQTRQLSANEHLLVFTEPDVELVAALNEFAQTKNIASGRLQAIGSVSSATLAWWNAETKSVDKYTVNGQFEVVSFLGNIASNTEGPRVHAHMILSGPGGMLIGGHCVSATVRASVEVNVTVFDTPVKRVLDDKFNLWVIDLSS